ncbi:MAG TPA: hypothetical protein VGZ73_13055 [Bryobacteraceae bacterium]|nr:hypothetical protein [Bryobacteraceae bacterium]
MDDRGLAEGGGGEEKKYYNTVKSDLAPILVGQAIRLSSQWFRTAEPGELRSLTGGSPVPPGHTFGSGSTAL